MYYYRNRYYDPRIGRFISEDPIGLAGGINLYSYVGNNAVNLIDPWGLIDWSNVIKGGLTGGGGITGGCSGGLGTLCGMGARFCGACWPVFGLVIGVCCGPVTGWFGAPPMKLGFGLPPVVTGGTPIGTGFGNAPGTDGSA